MICYFLNPVGWHSGLCCWAHLGPSWGCIQLEHQLGLSQLASWASFSLVLSILKEAKPSFLTWWQQHFKRISLTAEAFIKSLSVLRLLTYYWPKQVGSLYNIRNSGSIFFPAWEGEVCECFLQRNPMDTLYPGHHSARNWSESIY